MQKHDDKLITQNNSSIILTEITDQLVKMNFPEVLSNFYNVIIFDEIG